MSCSSSTGLLHLLLDDAGQSVAEFPIIVSFLLVMILIMLQPAIILYDRIVIENAAAEACRIMVTNPAAATDHHQDHIVNFVKRRMSAIPKTDFFMRVNPFTGDPKIEVSGNDTPATGRVSVKITIKAKPLPLVSLAKQFGLFGSSVHDPYNFVIVAESTAQGAVRDDDKIDSTTPSEWLGVW